MSWNGNVGKVGWGCYSGSIYVCHTDPCIFGRVTLGARSGEAVGASGQSEE